MRILAIALFFILFLGCRHNIDKEKLNHFFEQYYETIQTVPNDDILKYYSSGFFESTTKDQLFAFLMSLQDKRGAFLSFKFQNVAQPDVDNPENIIVVYIISEFEKGDDIEIFTLKHSGENNSFKIYTQKSNYMNQSN